MRPQIQPKTFEQATLLLDTIRLQKTDGPVPALRYLLSEWPELKKCTHQHLGDLLGLARETISRNYWEAI
ncbi:MAG: hypothetical protein HGA20_14955 [Geobacteraceae bacterium]|nr:hypothetical protein [Geobacteraceae bacterium]